MINFSEWASTLLEVFGSFSYKVPEDKEQQLYDFYMLNFIRGRSSLAQRITQMHKQGITTKPPKPSFEPGGRYGGMTREDEIDYMIEEVRKTLLPTLKENLLDAVFFSVAAEIRHVTDEVSEGIKGVHRNVENELGPQYAKMFRDYLKNLELRQSSVTSPFMRKPKTAARGLGIKERMAYNQANRVKSYYAALKSTDNKAEFMRLAKFLYGNLNWAQSYGGKAWEGITKGWLKLNEAKKPNEMFIWIDHVYDLQHNTSTVLNKVQSYSRDGGFGWLKEALDHKARIKEAHEIIDKISPQMRKLALPTIKLKFGKSLEQFKEEKILRKFKAMTDTPTFQNFSGSLLQKLARLMAFPELMTRDTSMSVEEIFRAAKIVYNLSNYKANQLRNLYKEQLDIAEILNSGPIAYIDTNVSGSLYRLTKAQAEKIFYKIPSKWAVTLNKLIPDDAYQDILELLRDEKTLAAIKRLREALGYGLRHSKNLVNFLIVANKVYGEFKPPVIHVAKQQQQAAQGLPVHQGQQSNITADDWDWLKSLVGGTAPAFSPQVLKSKMDSYYTYLRDRLNKLAAPAKEHILKNHNKPGSTIKTMHMLNITLNQAHDLEEYVVSMAKAGGLAA